MIFLLTLSTLTDGDFTQSELLNAVYGLDADRVTTILATEPDILSIESEINRRETCWPFQERLYVAVAEAGKERQDAIRRTQRQRDTPEESDDEPPCQEWKELSCLEEQLSVARALRDAGLSVRQYGSSALLEALARRQPGYATWLTKGGADVNSRRTHRLHYGFLQSRRISGNTTAPRCRVARFGKALAQSGGGPCECGRIQPAPGARRVVM